MTGFPHTPEGAIGQLAQIDLAVLQSMSLSTAEEVYNAWALPGGVRAEDVVDHRQRPAPSFPAPGWARSRTPAPRSPSSRPPRWSRAPTAPTGRPSAC